MPDPAGSVDIITLYHDLLAAWNARNSARFAGCFADGALVVGFDGSQMVGPAEIEAALRAVFSSHNTARYVSKIRSTRELGPDIAILHAVAGMVPPGQTDLNPAVNAIQVLVGRRTASGWLIESFQNTPAAFHGRPELSRALTDELREVLRNTA